MTGPRPAGPAPGRAGVVVVGAGLAGVTACEQLRELGHAGPLTLVGAEAELPYDRPPLSKELLAGHSEADGIRLHPEGWYAEHGVELRLGVPVEAVLPAEGRVLLADGHELPAGAVLLATGGRPRTLPVPGGDHPAVRTLRTVSDALELRAALGPGTRVAVIGGGLIGAEVAATAAGRGCAVTLLDPDPLPLERLVGPDVAWLLRDEHARHGVALRTGTVTAVLGSGPTARLLVAGAGPVDCEVAVAGIGIVPELTLAVAAGLDVDRGVLVDAARRSSHPHVFAAGDVARQRGARAPAGHWDAAVRDGRAAAAGILGVPGPPRPAPWFWTDRYGRRLEVVGDPTAGAPVLRGSVADRAFAVVAVRDGRCVGAAVMGRPRDAAALRRLVGQDVEVPAGLLADETADLRRLARA